MKLGVATKDSPQESRAKRFGFGYEEQSKNSPSTQTARVEFLSLMLELRPDVVSKLFNIAFQPFNELLAENQSIIASLYESLESELPQEARIQIQSRHTRTRAIRKFIPNWRSSQQIEDATPLRQALQYWAFEQNLIDDWCLDHALTFLRTLDESDTKQLSLNRGLHAAYCLRDKVRRAWWRASRHIRSDALGAQLESIINLKDRSAPFMFEYEELRFTVAGPFYKAPSAFKQEVNQEFEVRGGPTLRGARKALSYQLNVYLERVATARKDLGLEEPPIRWAAADHFKWLIDYQIPPYLNYRRIGRKFDKHDKTVREGIQDVAKLIGLTLRSSAADQCSGRPRGAKDKGPRRRVDRRKEKPRGNAS